MAAYWGIAAHSAYDMFSWYTYLSVILVFFPPLGLWSGNIFLVASFPDHCLLVPFSHAIYGDFSAVKIKKISKKKFDILIFLLETLFVGARQVRTASPPIHNLCFGSKLRKSSKTGV